MTSNRTLYIGLNTRAALNGSTWAKEIAIKASFSSCGVSALIKAIDTWVLIFVEEKAIK